MPANPTASSAKRALTYSFGPIAFGSLIIAAIQLVRYLVRSAAGRNSIIGAIFDCLIGAFVVVCCGLSMILLLYSSIFLSIIIDCSLINR
jgi:hypothetical protein